MTVPLTVTLSESFCDFARSLFGSTSARFVNAPTQNVRNSETPVAVRSRI